MNKKKLLLVATVPETFATILKHQPGYLHHYYDVSLVTSRDNQYDKLLRQEGVSINFVPMIRGISPLRDLWSIFCMIMLIRKIRPDVVHSYTPKAGLVSMISAFLCRVPSRIHTFTGLVFPTHRGLKQKILMLSDRLVCACASRVVPEGEGVKADLRAFRITRKPLHVIGHGNIAGVDTGYFDPSTPNFSDKLIRLDRRLALNSEDFVFCFIGRLNRDKGISELVNAFSELPDNAHLIAAGCLDETAAIDEKTLNALESHPRIHLLGFQEDIRPVLTQADVLVLPSYREGFPNVVLQAFAMETPVIATKVNGCNEIIVPENNGWLVPVKSTEALLSAMQSAMVAGSDKLAVMGQSGRTLIETRFEREEHWQRMHDFYAEVIVESKRG
ncbi:glycosyltransferase family 4 protein [Aestuariirhabdus sp. Z084]|uniref:glycosyltransferase family 4 protein n=1 Tax=Aestuariirhabdus haliotis TaxID=2918751 RepID=UPI0020BFAE61|nr:glycosyltransferase family 4 protein [Aestuariirhabdus haliotis]MCL6415808.1 glycosyltransferase family 4 protein [Aestuariirhabdus haliotis]